MPHFTTVASRCQSSFGLLAASHRSFVRSCRGGSRSCSAISPSPAGRGGHAVEPSRRRRRNCPASPSRRLRSFLAPSIGTLPPHRWPDSSLSARSTSFHCNFGGRRCGSHLHFRSIRSDGRKLPRPSETAVRPKIPEAARLRPAKTSNSPRCFARAGGCRHACQYGARLRLSPRTRH